MSKIQKSILSGVVSALIVFFSGFFVMNIFWQILEVDKSLLGLFDYKAATIGDAVCLPLLVGALVAFRVYNHKIKDKELKISFYFSVFGMLVGMFIQMSWLLRDDIQLNWSLPKLYCFNVAGWYHSLFFIGMFGVVGYELSRVGFELKNKKTNFDIFEQILLLVAVFTSDLFLLLYLFDNYGNEFDSVFLCDVAFILGLFVFLSSAKIKCLKWNEICFALLLGLLGSYGIGLLLVKWGETDILLALVGALSSCFLWRVDRLTYGEIIIKDITSFMCYFCGLLACFGHHDLKSSIVMLAAILVITFLLERNSEEKFRCRGLSLLAVMIYYIVLYYGSNKIDFSSDMISSIFICAVGVFFEKEINDYFSSVQAAENERNQQLIKEKVFREKKIATYIQIVIGVIALLLVIIRWLITIANKNGKHIEIGALQLDMIQLCVILLLTGFLFALGIPKVKSLKISRFLSFIIVMIAQGLVIKNMLGLVKHNQLMENDLSKIIMLIIPAFACIGAPLLLAHGYYMNVVKLRKIQYKRAPWIVVVSTCHYVGSFLFCVMVDLVLVSDATWVNLLLVLLNIVYIFVILPVLSARANHFGLDDTHVVPNQYLGGIVQDGLMITAIVIFVICIPCLYVEMMNEPNLGVVAGGIGLFSSAFLPVGFALRKNIEHIEAQRKVVDIFPEEADLWERLHFCLKIQSIQTIIALLPYVIVVTLYLFWKKYTLKKGDAKLAIEEIINEYIDKYFKFD